MWIICFHFGPQRVARPRPHDSALPAFGFLPGRTRHAPEFSAFPYLVQHDVKHCFRLPTTIFNFFVDRRDLEQSQWMSFIKLRQTSKLPRPSGAMISRTPHQTHLVVVGVVVLRIRSIHQIAFVITTLADKSTAAPAIQLLLTNAGFRKICRSPLPHRTFCQFFNIVKILLDLGDRTCPIEGLHFNLCAKSYTRTGLLLMHLFRPRCGAWPSAVRRLYVTSTQHTRFIVTSMKHTRFHFVRVVVHLIQLSQHALSLVVVPSNPVVRRQALNLFQLTIAHNRIIPTDWR